MKEIEQSVLKKIMPEMVTEKAPEKASENVKKIEPQSAQRAQRKD